MAVVTDLVWEIVAVIARLILKHLLSLCEHAKRVEELKVFMLMATSG
jgi:hypothetical protein